MDTIKEFVETTMNGNLDITVGRPINTVINVGEQFPLHHHHHHLPLPSQSSQQKQTYIRSMSREIPAMSSTVPVIATQSLLSPVSAQDMSLDFPPNGASTGTKVRVREL